MGRTSNDPIVIQSSIALLQERFKRLQRVRQMREERELHRMLVYEPTLINNNTNMHHEPSRLFFHFLPIKSSSSSSSSSSSYSYSSSPQVSLSLWSNSQGKLHDTDHHHHHLDRSVETTPLIVSLRAMSETPSPMLHASSKKFESSYNWDDVDTSLHL